MDKENLTVSLILFWLSWGFISAYILSTSNTGIMTEIETKVQNADFFNAIINYGVIFVKCFTLTIPDIPIGLSFIVIILQVLSFLVVVFTILSHLPKFLN